MNTTMRKAHLRYVKYALSTLASVGFAAAVPS